MTQSGGRGDSPSEFLRRLARTPGISQRSFIAQARAAGIRFSNDVYRGIFNALRGISLTGGQRRALARASLRLSVRGRPLTGATRQQLTDDFSNLLSDLVKRAVPNIMTRITYRVNAVVGFVWESGSVDNDTAFVSIEREVTISLDQLDSFNANIEGFASTHESTLIDIGASRLGLDSSYGEYIFTEAPIIEVLGGHTVGSV